MTSNIRLGVTGLRQSGKTVFLTALIHQLKHLGSKHLPRFDREGVELVPAPSVRPPAGAEAFPYTKNLEGLRQDPPRWPPPTEGESELTLEFVCWRGPARRIIRRAGRKLFGGHSDRRKIRLTVHDYPGEYPKGCLRGE